MGANKLNHTWVQTKTLCHMCYKGGEKWSNVWVEISMGGQNLRPNVSQGWKKSEPCPVGENIVKSQLGGEKLITP